MIDQAASARTKGLDAACFVVIGEGLAAGAGSFALTEDSQITSFPVQAARQMRTSLAVPYLQAPGIPGAPGFPTQPVIVPNLMQTRVVDAFPLRSRHQHLAIPGYEVSDCVRRRPVPPLIHRHDARQTIANLVLGLPALTTDPGAQRATQLEYAVDCGPTLALVVLGYAEALRALFSGDVSCVPPPGRWAREYEHVARTLAETGAALVLATIPDPADTPACSSLEDAAQLLRVDAAEITRRYPLDAGDYLTVYGLVKIGGDVLAGGTSLDSRDVIRGGVRKAVSEYVTGADGRLMRSIKSVLGTSLFNDTTRVKRQALAFSDILGLFIAELKRRAEAALGQAIQEIVCGRPVAAKLGGARSVPRGGSCRVGTRSGDCLQRS